MKIKLVDIRDYLLNQDRGDAPYIVYGFIEDIEKLLELEESGICVLLELYNEETKDYSEEELANLIHSQKEIHDFSNIVFNRNELTEDYLNRVYSIFYHKDVVVAEIPDYFIREMKLEDANGLYDLYSQEDVREFVTPILRQETFREKIDEYIYNYKSGQYAFFDYGMWTIIEKSSEEFVGRIGIEDDTRGGYSGIFLGYALKEKFRGKGIVVNFAKEILNYIERNEIAEEVYICCDKENLNSIKVAEALGAHKRYQTIEKQREILIYEINSKI